MCGCYVLRVIIFLALFCYGFLAYQSSFRDASARLQPQNH